MQALPFPTQGSAARGTGPRPDSHGPADLPGEWPVHMAITGADAGQPRCCLSALVSSLSLSAAQHMAARKNSPGSRFWMGHPGCKARYSSFSSSCLTDLGACCVQDDCRNRILCNPHYQKLEQAAGVWRKVLVVSASSSSLSVLLATAKWSEAGTLACTRQQLQDGQGSLFEG